MSIGLDPNSNSKLTLPNLVLDYVTTSRAYCGIGREVQAAWSQLNSLMSKAENAVLLLEKQGYQYSDGEWRKK